MMLLNKNHLNFYGEDGSLLVLPNLELFLAMEPQTMATPDRFLKAYTMLRSGGATHRQCHALATLFEDQGLGLTEAHVIVFHDLEIEISADGTIVVGIDLDTILKTSCGWQIENDRLIDDLETAVQVVLAKRRQ